MRCLSEWQWQGMLCVVFALLCADIGQQVRFSPQFLMRAFRPALGLQSSVPAPVFEALPLLYKNGVKTFRLSDGIVHKEGSLHQRFIEASYPMRVEPALMLITFAGEAAPAYCKRLEQGEEVALYDCKP